MAKREWIGNYKLHYVEYYSYKDEQVMREANLGHCLGVDEAIVKAICFLDNQSGTVYPRYISDGWGNKFKA